MTATRQKGRKAPPLLSTVEGVKKVPPDVNRCPEKSPPLSSVAKKKSPPLLSTVSGVPTIAEIEAMRVRADMSVKRLCRLAEISVRAYQCALRGTHKKAPRPATLRALARALGERQKPRIGTLAMLWRAALGLVAIKLGLDPVAAGASQGKIYGRARTLAAWCVRSESDGNNAELAAAIGVSRQNVKQALDEAADWREADPAIADVTDQVGAILRGRAAE